MQCPALDDAEIALCLEFGTDEKVCCPCETEVAELKKLELYL